MTLPILILILVVLLLTLGTGLGLLIRRRSKLLWIPAAGLGIWMIYVVYLYLLILGPVGLLPRENRTTIIEISRGTSLTEIGYILKRHHIISRVKHFTFVVTLLGYEKKLKAGYYELPDLNSHYDLVRFLEMGKSVEVKITIPEGLPAKEIAHIIERDLELSGDRFLSHVFDSTLTASLNVDASNLEGYLLPETYFVYKGITEEALVKLLVKNFRSVITDSMLQQLDTFSLSLHEVITLASIIEGEAMRDEERVIVSAVYHNRLKRRMRLEADPTIQYIIPDGPRRLLYEDLRIESPYNTYRYSGLPPGPINNPGKKSILAAFFPEEADHLFMVARGDGYHTFSRTSKEHLSAKKAFDAIRRKVARDRRRQIQNQ